MSQPEKKEENALTDILKIGTSAGGARAKAIIAYHPQTGAVKSGQTDAPKGFTHWLIKLDGVTDTQFGASSGYGRIEMAHHKMATACEIEMTECRLLEENGRAYFMARHFDRVQDGEKIYVQSFFAMKYFDFNDILSYSYEQLFQTLRELHLPYKVKNGIKKWNQYAEEQKVNADLRKAITKTLLVL